MVEPSSASGGTPEAARRIKTNTMTSEADGINVGILSMSKNNEDGLIKPHQRESLDQSYSSGI